MHGSRSALLRGPMHLHAAQRPGDDGHEDDGEEHKHHRGDAPRRARRGGAIVFAGRLLGRGLIRHQRIEASSIVERPVVTLAPTG